MSEVRLEPKALLLRRVSLPTLKSLRNRRRKPRSHAFTRRSAVAVTTPMCVPGPCRQSGCLSVSTFARRPGSRRDMAMSAPASPTEPLPRDLPVREPPGWRAQQARARFLRVPALTPARAVPYEAPAARRLSLWKDRTALSFLPGRSLQTYYSQRTHLSQTHMQDVIPEKSMQFTVIYQYLICLLFISGNISVAASQPQRRASFTAPGPASQGATGPRRTCYRLEK